MRVVPSLTHWTTWESMNKHRNDSRTHRRDQGFNVALPSHGLRPVDGRLRVAQVSGTDSIGILLLGGKGRVQRPETRMPRCIWSRDGGTPATLALRSG